MSIFGAYMAKYFDIRQHQLSRLSHMREEAQEMYSKVQADSRVPQMEKDLEEARLKWVDLAKERVALAAEVKKVPKLGADVTELRRTISELHNAHQAELEGLRNTHQAKIERLCSLHLAEIERKEILRS